MGVCVTQLVEGLSYVYKVLSLDLSTVQTWIVYSTPAGVMQKDQKLNVILKDIASVRPPGIRVTLSQDQSPNVF